eukprot:756711-Hanusia_phi.AAC.7
MDTRATFWSYHETRVMGRDSKEEGEGGRRLAGELAALYSSTELSPAQRDAKVRILYAKDAVWIDPLTQARSTLHLLSISDMLVLLLSGAWGRVDHCKLQVPRALFFVIQSGGARCRHVHGGRRVVHLAVTPICLLLSSSCRDLPRSFDGVATYKIKWVPLSLSIRQWSVIELNDEQQIKSHTDHWSLEVVGICLVRSSTPFVPVSCKKCANRGKSVFEDLSSQHRNGVSLLFDLHLSPTFALLSVLHPLIGLHLLQTRRKQRRPVQVQSCFLVVSSHLHSRKSISSAVPKLHIQNVHPSETEDSPMVSRKQENSDQENTGEAATASREVQQALIFEEEEEERMTGVQEAKETREEEEPTEARNQGEVPIAAGGEVEEGEAQGAEEAEDVVDPAEAGDVDAGEKPPRVTGESEAKDKGAANKKKNRKKK